MTTYFNPADPAHVNLLPPGYRAHQDMPVVAGVSEADVIDYYTEVPSYWWLATSQLGFIQYPWGWGGLENPGTDITAPNQQGQVTSPRLRVYLKGYKPDDGKNTAGTGSTDPLVDPNLVQAMKRTIAEVIFWRLSRWTTVEPGVQSAASDIGKSKVFRANSEDAFPPDWNRGLIVFASGRAPWGW
jgi:hypothetical protein